MSLFIALEGIDGSGKSSTAVPLAKELNAVYVEKKAVQSEIIFVNEQIKRIKDANYPGYNGQYDHLMGTTYWLYLQCVWYSLIYVHSVKPLLSAGKSVVVDGWFYKFIAKVSGELGGAIKPRTAFELVPEPDIVIMLDVDPLVALKRKGSFTAYEAGSHTGMDPTSESFLRFQSRIRAELHSLKDHKWCVIPVDETDDQGSVQSRVIENLRALGCRGF